MLSNGLETRTTEPPVYASAGTCGAYVRTEAYDGPVTSLTQGPQAVGVALHEPPAGRAGGPSPAAPGAPGTARPTLEGRFMATEQVQKEQGTSPEPGPVGRDSVETLRPTTLLGSTESRPTGFIHALRFPSACRRVVRSCAVSKNGLFIRRGILFQSRFRHQGSSG